MDKKSKNAIKSLSEVLSEMRASQEKQLKWRITKNLNLVGQVVEYDNPSYSPRKGIFLGWGREIHQTNTVAIVHTATEIEFMDPSDIIFPALRALAEELNEETEDDK